MKKKKDFFIVRYFLNDEVEFAHEISRKDIRKFVGYTEEMSMNNAGGVTVWFRIDIQPKEENL